MSKAEAFCGQLWACVLLCLLRWAESLPMDREPSENAGQLCEEIDGGIRADAEVLSRPHGRGPHAFRLPEAPKAAAKLPITPAQWVRTAPVSSSALNLHLDPFQRPRLRCCPSAERREAEVPSSMPSLGRRGLTSLTLAGGVAVL